MKKVTVRCKANWFKASAALLMTMIASHSFAAGGANGGGGKGVVCRNKDNSVKSVELLDLWEARVLDHRTIVYSNKPVNQQIAESIARLKNISPDERFTVNYADGRILVGSDGLADILANEAKRFFNLPDVTYADYEHLHGVHLTPTEDSFEEALPEDCKVEQLVRYKDTNADHGGSNHVLINQDLMDKMNSTNQTALSLHEALYKALRVADGESTSVRVRKAIGLIMSGYTFKPLAALLQKPYIKCESTQTLFYYVQEVPGPRGLVVTLAEKVAGIIGLGFGEWTGSGTGPTVEEVFAYLNSNNIGSGGGAGNSESPIDGDLGFMVLNMGKAKESIQVDQAAPGFTTPRTDTVTCKMIK